jgi:hypothetical protein
MVCPGGRLFRCCGGVLLVFLKDPKSFIAPWWVSYIIFLPGTLTWALIAVCMCLYEEIRY